MWPLFSRMPPKSAPLIARLLDVCTKPTARGKEWDEYIAISDILDPLIAMQASMFFKLSKCQTNLPEPRARTKRFCGRAGFIHGVCCLGPREWDKDEQGSRKIILNNIISYFLVTPTAGCGSSLRRQGKRACGNIEHHGKRANNIRPLGSDDDNGERACLACTCALLGGKGSREPEQWGSGAGISPLTDADRDAECDSGHISHDRTLHQVSVSVTG